jgi:hypothetical protein
MSKKRDTHRHSTVNYNISYFALGGVLMYPGLTDQQVIGSEIFTAALTSAGIWALNSLEFHGIPKERLSWHFAAFRGISRYSMFGIQNFSASMKWCMNKYLNIYM